MMMHEKLLCKTNMNKSCIYRHTKPDEDQKPMNDTWKIRTAQRSMSIDNINFLSSPSSSSIMKPFNDNIDNSDIQSYDGDTMDSKQKSTPDYDSGHENQKINDDDNIIPWKKLLRKTNSRLNLIS